jgi:hypothetical protein
MDSEEPPRAALFFCEPLQLTNTCVTETWLLRCAGYALEQKLCPERCALLAQNGVTKLTVRTPQRDPITEMVAKRLVELATSGIGDPVRLEALTVQACTKLQQQQQQIQRLPG